MARHWPWSRALSPIGAGVSIPVRPTHAERTEGHAWQQLSPLQRSFQDIEPIAPLASFTAGLTTARNPSFVGPLGHLVGSDGPTGFVDGIASLPEPHPMTNGPALVLPLSRPTAGANAPSALKRSWTGIRSSAQSLRTLVAANTADTVDTADTADTVDTVNTAELQHTAGSDFDSAAGHVAADHASTVHSPSRATEDFLGASTGLRAHRERSLQTVSSPSATEPFASPKRGGPRLPVTERTTAASPHRHHADRDQVPVIQRQRDNVRASEVPDPVLAQSAGTTESGGLPERLFPPVLPQVPETFPDISSAVDLPSATPPIHTPPIHIAPIHTAPTHTAPAQTKPPHRPAVETAELQQQSWVGTPPVTQYTEPTVGLGNLMQVVAGRQHSETMPGVATFASSLASSGVGPTTPAVQRLQTASSLPMFGRRPGLGPPLNSSSHDPMTRSAATLPTASQPDTPGQIDTPGQPDIPVQRMSLAGAAIENTTSIGRQRGAIAPPDTTPPPLPPALMRDGRSQNYNANPLQRSYSRDILRREITAPGLSSADGDPAAMPPAASESRAVEPPALIDPAGMRQDPTIPASENSWSINPLLGDLVPIGNTAGTARQTPASHPPALWSAMPIPGTPMVQGTSAPTVQRASGTNFPAASGLRTESSARRGASTGQSAANTQHFESQVLQRSSDPGAAAVSIGAAQHDGNGGVVFFQPKAENQSLQRDVEATTEVNMPGSPAGPSQSSPTAAVTPAAVTPAATPAGADAGTAGAMPDLDELARRLFDPLSARLKTELWLDRERAGLITDLRR